MKTPLTHALSILAGICLTSCGQLAYQPDLTSLSPQERVLGLNREIKLAQSSNRNAGPEVYKALTFMLGSPDAGERMFAIAKLEDLTGERRGYDPIASPSERRAAQAQWELWLRNRSPDTAP